MSNLTTDAQGKTLLLKLTTLQEVTRVQHEKLEASLNDKLRDLKAEGKELLTFKFPKFLESIDIDAKQEIDRLSQTVNRRISAANA